MAYVLGFWFADGYMRREKSYRILFTSNDRQIIEDILLAMYSSHPVQKQGNAYFISLCSKRLYIDLEKLGGYRRKSRTITLPVIPEKYLPDFLRGYFDGDGSVFLQSYKATKNGKIYTELRCNFTSGSRKFMDQLNDLLQTKIGLPKRVLGVFDDGHSLKLGYSTKATKKLLAYMYYPGFPIGLQRKAKFAKLGQ